MNGIFWTTCLVGWAPIAFAQEDGTNFLAKLSDGDRLQLHQVAFGTNMLNLNPSGKTTRIDPKEMGRRFRPTTYLRVWASVSPERDNPKFTRWILSNSGQHFPQGSYTRRTIGERTEHGVRFETFPRRDREAKQRAAIEEYRRRMAGQN